jgi:hypothetical protein
VPLDQTFERRPSEAGERAAALAAAADRHGVGRAQAAAAPVPVLDALGGLLPQGLPRGEAVSVGTREGTPDFLTLALLAGALRAGLWCAAVGLAGAAGPGGVALADLLGRDAGQRRAGLERLLVVPEPGERWAEAAASLADGVDLLVVRPPGQAAAQLVRRVDARLRRGVAALVVLGPWPTARLELRTARTVWTGLDGVGPTAGTGHLTGGQATVVAEGRATAGRPRTVRLWLPSASGAVAALTEEAPAPAATTVPARRLAAVA